MMSFNTPEDVYSATSGNRISTHGKPEINATQSEEYFTVRMEVYARARDEGSLRHTLRGVESWVDWGDGTRTNPEDVSFNSSEIATFTKNYSGSRVGVETIPDTRLRYDADWEPLPLSPDATVDVFYVTIYTRGIESPGGNYPSTGMFYLGFIRTLFDPLPVISNSLFGTRRGGNQRSFLPEMLNFGEENPQFRAPAGILRWNYPVFDFNQENLGTGQQYRINLGWGVYLDTLPSLFSPESKLEVILGRVEMPRTSRQHHYPVSTAWRVDWRPFSTNNARPATRVLRRIEPQSLGSNIREIHDFAAISFVYVSTRDFSNIEGIDSGLFRMQGQPRVLNNFRTAHGLTFNLAREGHREAVRELYSAINNTGNAEDHPFFFDASELREFRQFFIERTAVAALDFEPYSISYDLGNPANAQEAAERLALIKPDLPSFENARSLRVYLNAREGDVSSAEGNIYAREVFYPNVFLQPQLPPAFSNPAAISGMRRTGHAARKNGASIVYRRTQWEQFGQEPWVMRGIGQEEPVIYPRIPANTKTVIGLHSGTGGAILCYSDGSINENGRARLTGFAPLPRIPNGVENIIDYYSNFIDGTAPVQESNIPYLDLEESWRDQGLENGEYRLYEPFDFLPEGQVVIPALPPSVRYLQDYLREGFRMAETAIFGVSSRMQIWGLSELNREDVNINTYPTTQRNIPISPANIKVELGEMPNLEEVVGWCEAAYSGAWRLEELDDVNDFIPVIKQPGVMIKKMFTFAFRDMIVSRRDRGGSSGSSGSGDLRNDSSQTVFGVPAGGMGRTVSRRGGIYGNFMVARRFPLNQLLNGIYPAGIEDSFEQAFNGNWYGNLGQFAEALGMQPQQMLANETRAQDVLDQENLDFGNYPGPGVIMFSHDGSSSSRVAYTFQDDPSGRTLDF